MEDYSSGQLKYETSVFTGEKPAVYALDNRLRMEARLKGSRTGQPLIAWVQPGRTNDNIGLLLDTSWPVVALVG